MCGVQCAVCSVRCAVCNVQCAVCSVQCAVGLGEIGLVDKKIKVPLDSGRSTQIKKLNKTNQL